MLTTAAGPDMEAIHDRQPVILPRDRRIDWLDLGRDGRLRWSPRCGQMIGLIRGRHNRHLPLDQAAAIRRVGSHLTSSDLARPPRG